MADYLGYPYCSSGLHSGVEIASRHKNHQADLSGPTNIKLLEACVIGVVAAVGAVLLKEGVGFIGAWRVHGLEHLNLAQAGLHQYAHLFLPAVGLLGGLVAGALVQFAAPQATGSGIPQVKAAISGVPQDLTIRTAAVKLVSCVIALGSGLSMGREGPTVQMAAALSANASKFIRSSPRHRAQLIAAGAGAGLAAAFNAPLAGVLFVLEELLGRMSGFTVGTTVVACFVAAVLSRLVGVHSLDIQMSKLNGLSTFAYQDIPFYLLLGVFAGLVGAVFNKSIIGGLTFVRDIVKWPITVTCGLAGLISGILVAASPPLYCDYSGLRETLVSGHLGMEGVLLALALQFALTVIAYSSGAPGGLFAPSLTMGACLGLLVSVLELHIYGSTNAVAFAVVGMGAVFCAVARVPMTAVVIIFEMTTDFNVVLPLMFCSVVAYLVAEKIDPGSIYDQLLEWGGISPEEIEHEPGIMKSLTASNIMQRHIETIDENATIAQVRKQFEESIHHGFPVVDSDHKPVGMVTTHDLMLFAKAEHKDEDLISAAMTANPVTIDSEQPLADAVLALENYKISRLPVVERGKLVGLITRTDIVSAESLALHRPKADPEKTSTVIYQTRSIDKGRGRILVSLSGASHDERQDLLQLSCMLAQGKAYELEYMHVIQSLQDSAQARLIAQEAESTSRTILREPIPVHTAIRLARHQAYAISDTVEDRHIDFVILPLPALITASSRVEFEQIVAVVECPLVIAGVQNFDLKSKKFVLVNSHQGEKFASELVQLLVASSRSKSATMVERAVVDGVSIVSIAQEVIEGDQCDVVVIGVDAVEGAGVSSAEWKTVLDSARSKKRAILFVVQK